MANDGMVSDSQAGGLGGGDKKNELHGKDTHQVSDDRNVVVIARFKPAASPFSADGMSSAAGMIGSVTDAVAGAASAVEDVMNSIPGLQMFIKEDKTKSPSEKEYKYEYTEWSSKIPLLDKKLKKLFPDNKVIDVFEFDAVDADGRKDAAQKLYNEKLKGALSGFSKYTVKIHLVGIGQGGNVMNELSDLLAKDSQFNSENWMVKSVFYVGTPVYSDLHKFNEKCLKDEGTVFHFACPLDLTQQVIAFYSPADELLKFIENCNSSTLSLAVGKIKLSIVKILSLFLGNSSFGSDNPHGLDKFDLIKPEIEGLIKQMTGMIKQIASEVAAFIDPGKLPDFGQALSGFDNVPSQSMDAFDTFLKNLSKTIEQQGKMIFAGGGGLGPQNLMGVFNCLCPLLEQITKAIATLDYDSPATIALANQVIENAGITEVYRKGQMEGTKIDLNDFLADYYQERIKVYKEEGRIDKINKMIEDASQLLVNIDKGKVNVKDLDDEKKMQLATGLYAIIQPMMISKKRVIEELQKWIVKLDIGSALEDIKANKLLQMAAPLLGTLNLQFDQPLNDSIGHVDSQLSRLKDFFKPHDYDLHKDTLYFIYNIHNQVINSCMEELQYNIDDQAGIIEFLHNRNCENQFLTSGKNTYNPEVEKDPGDVMKTNKIPETATS